MATIDKPQFWVPSANRPCGIAEYTNYLDVWTKAGMVNEYKEDGPIHVQHEFGLFPASGRLTAFLVKAGHPFFVTEHTTPEGPPLPFEIYARSIVVHTRKQFEIVANRTQKPVHLIPHGCFRGTEPRKKFTNTVACFGFMTPSKGFDKVVQAVKEVGANLLLISTANNGPFQKSLESKLDGVEHEWISDFKDIEEVRALLRKKADVVAYWYKEQQYGHSASGATAIGLSTGVPVLTNHSSWFLDVPTLKFRSLTDGLNKVLNDKELRKRQSIEQLQYCEGNSWELTALRHQQMWESV